MINSSYESKIIIKNIQKNLEPLAKINHLKMVDPYLKKVKIKKNKEDLK